MRKALTFIFASPVLIVLILIIVINVNINYRPTLIVQYGDSLNSDFVNVLHGLEDAINAGADEEMQQVYPEGFIFLNATYALAWCNGMKNQSRDSEFYQHGLSEIETCWNKINSVHARSQFEEELPLAYGAFYAGWSNYLLGRKLALQHANERDSIQEKLFKKKL